MAALTMLHIQFYANFGPAWRGELGVLLAEIRFGTREASARFFSTGESKQNDIGSAGGGPTGDADGASNGPRGTNPFSVSPPSSSTSLVAPTSVNGNDPAVGLLLPAPPSVARFVPLPSHRTTVVLDRPVKGYPGEWFGAKTRLGKWRLLCSGDASLVGVADFRSDLLAVRESAYVVSMSKL